MKNASNLGYALAALCAICATVLVMAGHPVPDFLQALGLFGAGGSIGATVPTRTSSTPAP